MTVQQMSLRLDDDEMIHKVLDVFEYTDGYATTGYLVDEIGTSRPTVTKRLDRLSGGEYIEYVHEPTAFWRLVEDPREEEDA